MNLNKYKSKSEIHHVVSTHKPQLDDSETSPRIHLRAILELEQSNTNASNGFQSNGTEHLMSDGLSINTPRTVYEYNSTRHEAIDIVHPMMCVQGFSNGTYTWSDLPGLPYDRSSAGCASQVPDYCHARASCAVKFGDLLRDAKNPAPLYDDFMRHCGDWNHSDVGIVGLGLLESCSRWNATVECVCDRGYVGNGKCCRDKQVLAR